MKSLSALYGEKMKKLTAADIAVLKVFCVIVGMLLGYWFASFVDKYETIFLVVGAVLLVVLMVRFFRKK